MSLAYREDDHTRDWHDYPSCAQPCLLSRTDGYWWRRCYRSTGGCCPSGTTEAEGIRHFDVWDCVLRRCGEGNDNGIKGHDAQDAADIFMRDCAMRGFPLAQNLTLGLGFGAAGDRFPEAYNYTDYVTPVQAVAVNGFYGWGSMLAWNTALIAAALAGIKPSTRNRLNRLASTSTRVFGVPRRWFGYVRRDAELLAALAIPCVAAGDIRSRWQRVSFHQVFMYDHPSFVPASDGEKTAVDILTTRAAIVIVNHFVTSAFVLTALPLAALSFSGQSWQSWRRYLFRTLAIMATFVWCIIATRPLYCGESHFLMDDWPGGCQMTNIFLRASATTSRVLPGVSCGSLDSAFPSLAMVYGILSLGATFLMWSGGMNSYGSRGEKVAFFLLVWLLTFLAIFSLFSALPYVVNSWAGFILTSFWYLLPNGRQCTFGPSNMIGFMEMDQIFALAIGGSVGLVSAWDSISQFVDLLREPIKHE